jgi:transposase-like protein/IS1 family transposase
MTLHVFFLLLLLVLMFSFARLCSFCWPHHGPTQSAAAKRTPLHRLLKPRSPHDCPACRLASTLSSVAEPMPPPVRPWREVKSRRGAPKRLNTEGFACPNQQCPYSGITDAHIHALVGDGTHGHAERIQTFRCQACHMTFTARRHTPLYRLKTPSCQVALVLTALAEGLDPSAAERIFGYRQATITAWLSRAGEHAQTLHERSFCNLQLPHLQLDELRTRLRCSTQVLWLWLAIDPLTKILPVLQLGPRTQNAAHRVIHSLRQILAPGCLPLFTSDGLNLYFYALTAHFGQWLEVGRRGRQWQVAAELIYGQVKKNYRRRKLVRVTHVMRLGTEAALKVALLGLGLSGRLNTAFIERANLTVRHGVAALARRTWATAQQAPQLLVHLEWWRAYYHFVRPHTSLRVALVQPRERGGKLVAQRYRQRTPAMAAGRTNRRWTAREVLSCPLPPIPA